MRLTLSLVAAVTLVSAGAAGRFDSAQTPPPSAAPKYAFGEPGISPDGREIAFTSGGDIWTVPASGGDARLLVADPANDRRPLFSPDGRELAFVSTRTGGGDIYVADARDRHAPPADVGRRAGAAGRLVARRPLDLLQLDEPRHRGHERHLPRRRRDGGTPMAVSADRYVNEFGAAASPDGHRLAFSRARHRDRASGGARAAATSTSRSCGSSTSTRSPSDGAKAYTEITKRDARQLWPMWSADGRRSSTSSDRGGAENIWTRPASATGADRAVTSFTDGRVLWPTITTDGRTIAFERDFGIWTLDTASGQAHEVPIARRGAPRARARAHAADESVFSDLALSPDGRKVAFVARGDVFAASAKDGGDAARVTATPALESQPAWAPDSRRLAYVSARDGGQQLRLYDFASSTRDAAHDGAATDLVAGVLARRAVNSRSSATARSCACSTSRRSRIACSRPARSPTRSTRRGPSGRPTASGSRCSRSARRRFTNVELVPARRRRPAAPVSFLANAYANTIAWSPDGTYLLFDTGQRTEPASSRASTSRRATPKFREDLFRDLFSEPARDRRNPAGTLGEPQRNRPGTTRNPKRTARRPSSRHPPAPDASSRSASTCDDVAISPDGKTAVVIAGGGGPDEPLRVLARRARDGPPGGAAADDDGRRQGRPAVHARQPRGLLPRRRPRSASSTIERARGAPADRHRGAHVDFASEKLQVFRAGVDAPARQLLRRRSTAWTGRHRARRYGERAAARRRPTRCGASMSLMIGDLNASHLGISGPGGTRRRSAGSASSSIARRFETRGPAASSPNSCRSARRRSRAGIAPATCSSPSTGGGRPRREPRRAARQHDRSTRRAVDRCRAAATNRDRGRRAADEPGDREGAAVPRVGRSRTASTC